MGYWTYSDASIPGVIWFVGLDGKTHWGTRKSIKEECVSEYDWCSDGTKIWCQSPGNPASRYASIEAAARACCIGCNQKAHIKIDALEMGFSLNFGVEINSPMSHDWTVSRCQIHHCGVLGAPHSADGITCRASNCTIENNEVHNAGRHGIFINTYGNITVVDCAVLRNVVYDCYHASIDLMNQDGVLSNHTIAFNTIYTTSDYADYTKNNNGIYTSALVDGQYADTIHVFYNVIFNVCGYGILLGAGTRAADIANNVTYTAHPKYAGATGGIKIHGDGVSDIHIVNNIAVGPFEKTQAAFMLVGDEGQVSFCDHNCWHTPSGSCAVISGIHYSPTEFAKYQRETGFDIHGLWEDPKFVRPTFDSPDFHPVNPGSPCLEAGMDIGLTRDIAGNSVPGWPGKTPDIGAYESAPGGDSAVISLNRTKLEFGAAAAGSKTQAQMVTVSNSGKGSLNWSASTNVRWLAISKISENRLDIDVIPEGLSPGSYHGQIAVLSPGAINSPQIISVTLSIYPADSAVLPFGSFDTPVDRSTVSGSVPVSGWALDGIAVASVRVYREPIAGELAGPSEWIYVGDALFIEGARPDIEQNYPSYPMNFRAGWGLMLLTNALPNHGNGTFVFHAMAFNRAGSAKELGAKTVHCDNAHSQKPFGAIDTPVPGETIAGQTFANFGWVLTPLPNLIPADGSTLTVWIDGRPVGHPVYNNYRPDVAAAFPNYANSNGAIGYFLIDTAGFTDGIHTLNWSAVDSAGNSEGIGSRYFFIQNATLSPAVIDDMPSANSGEDASIPIARYAEIPVDRTHPIGLRKGFDPLAMRTMIGPPREKELVIPVGENDRLEIQLGLAAPESEHDHYSGYLRVGDELRPLPAGSRLDQRAEIFTWSLGPGFLGEYELVFLRSRAGATTKSTLRVSVKPKFSLL